MNSYIKCASIGMTGGIVWEYFAPVINVKTTTDHWDLLCYFIGISIYYLVFRIETNYLKKFKERETHKTIP